MPTTRKQKKARKSREVNMLSDIENLDVMLGGNHLKRDESEISNHGRRPESPRYDTLLNQNSILISIFFVFRKKCSVDLV